MWKNTVEQDRPRMTIWQLRIPSWISRATNTQLEYVIKSYCFLTATMV
jgi:hypothetical protein